MHRPSPPRPSRNPGFPAKSAPQKTPSHSAAGRPASKPAAAPAPRRPQNPPPPHKSNPPASSRTPKAGPPPRGAPHISVNYHPQPAAVHHQARPHIIHTATPYVIPAPDPVFVAASPVPVPITAVRGEMRHVVPILFCVLGICALITGMVILFTTPLFFEAIPLITMGVIMTAISSGYLLYDNFRERSEEKEEQCATTVQNASSSKTQEEKTTEQVK